MPREIHYQTNTRLYQIWSNMKQRCYNPKASKFSSFGGKGIKMCDAWKESFLAFQEWALSNGYQDPPKENSRFDNAYKSLTINRIDKKGDYTPTNCKWTTYDETRKSRRHETTYCGKSTELRKAWRASPFTPHCILKQVGITLKEFWNYEMGKSRPSQEVTQKLANALGVPAETLFPVEGSRKEATNVRAETD